MPLYLVLYVAVIFRHSCLPVFTWWRFVLCIFDQNNCCEFLASYGVIIQSVIQSYLKMSVCGASLSTWFLFIFTNAYKILQHFQFQFYLFIYLFIYFRTAWETNIEISKKWLETYFWNALNLGSKKLSKLHFSKIEYSLIKS